MKGAAVPRAAFRDVFAVREFRAVWFSEILSVAGDRRPWSPSPCWSMTGPGPRC